MFPIFRQRICVIAAAVVAGLIYLPGADVAQAADGADGCTLLFAAAPLTAIGQFLLLSAPVLALATLASAISTPLAGVFVGAAALTFPAVAGGSIDHWLRSVESAEGYWSLAIESAVWAVIGATMMLLSYRAGRRLRALLPNWMTTEDYPGEGEDEEPMVSHRWFWLTWGLIPPPSGSPLSTDAQSRRLGVHPNELSQSAGAVLAAIIVGAFLAWVLLRTTDTWQVVWGLWLAFLLAGMIAHQIFPGANAMAILLTPFAVAAIWYAYGALTLGTAEQMLASHFSRQFGANGALALPVFYASAGVAGASMGVGWSRSLHEAAEHEAEVQAAEQGEQ